jgi:hypothetical protein
MSAPVKQQLAANGSAGVGSPKAALITTLGQ